MAEDVLKHRTSLKDPHPAPGRLRLVQQFLNTRQIETNTDELASPQAVADWLSHRRLLEANATLDEPAWQQCLAARKALRSLARHHSGRPMTAGEVEAFQHTFGGVQPFLRLANNGQLGLVVADGNI